MNIQPNYNKFLDPITDVTTSVEALLEGAFGPLMGDQREELKRIYTSAWGLHTLIMDIVSNIGIENVAQRAYLRQKFDSFLTPMVKIPRNLIHGLDGPLTEEQTVCVEYLEEVGMLLRLYLDKLWLYSEVNHQVVEYNQSALDIGGVIQSIIPSLESLSVTFDLELSDNLPLIQGDETLVMACVREIVQNALDNTHEGYIRMVADVGNQYLTICIEDTGIGIDDTDLDAVFQPFYKILDDTDGIGLGLSIVQGLMMLMRGRVRLYSQPDHGTSVYLDFSIV